MSEDQLQIPFIDHEVEETIILQRVDDGYINATAMCQAQGKKINDYTRLGQTKEFLDALSSDTGIPVTGENGLIKTIQGGSPSEQGTWAHPDVAINLGQWLSGKFAVLVSKWVRDWLTGNIQSANLPYHLRRYMANRSEIPYDHFSILNEMVFAVIAPLESRGYTLPDNMIPDISQGIMFANWLREKGYVLDDFPRYTHRYEDGRVCEPRLYPNSLLDEFRRHFYEVWIPTKSYEYFAKRDPKALPYLEEVFMVKGGEKSTKKLKDALPKLKEVNGFDEALKRIAKVPPSKK